MPPEVATTGHVHKGPECRTGLQNPQFQKYKTKYEKKKAKEMEVKVFEGKEKERNRENGGDLG